MTTTTGSTWTLAGRFLDALTARDFAGIADCLHADVRMRALVPPGPFELSGPDAVRARFEAWFGGDNGFELLDASIGEVGPRLYLRWRVRMRAPDSAAARVAEQHAFVDAGSRVESIDLLCSGWVADGDAD